MTCPRQYSAAVNASTTASGVIHNKKVSGTFSFPKASTGSYLKAVSFESDSDFHQFRLILISISLLGPILDLKVRNLLEVNQITGQQSRSIGGGRISPDMA